MLEVVKKSRAVGCKGFAHFHRCLNPGDHSASAPQGIARPLCDPYFRKESQLYIHGMNNEKGTVYLEQGDEHGLQSGSKES